MLASGSYIPSSHPAACARSNLLSYTAGRPFGGCAISPILVSRILSSNCVRNTGVTIAGRSCGDRSVYRRAPTSSPGVPARLDDVPPLSTLLARKTLLAVRLRPAYEVVWSPVKDPRAVVSDPSSLYRSQRVYKEMISCAMLAMTSMLTLRPAINPMVS